MFETSPSLSPRERRSSSTGGASSKSSKCSACSQARVIATAHSCAESDLPPMSKILLALFVLHVGAAIYHQAIKKDHLLARMGVGRA